MTRRRLALSLRTLLALVLAGSALAGIAAGPTSAAGDDAPSLPLRVSVKVTKSGGGSKLRRLAVAYPTAAAFTATCTRGRADGGPCPANGSPVEGLECAPLADAPQTTKCELRSTKAKPIWLPRGEAMNFAVTQSGYRATAATVTFTRPGRYRVTTFE